MRGTSCLFIVFMFQSTLVAKLIHKASDRPVTPLYANLTLARISTQNDGYNQSDIESLPSRRACPRDAWPAPASFLRVVAGHIGWAHRRECEIHIPEFGEKILPVVGFNCQGINSHKKKEDVDRVGHPESR